MCDQSFRALTKIQNRGSQHRLRLHVIQNYTDTAHIVNKVKASPPATGIITFQIPYMSEMKPRTIPPMIPVKLETIPCIKKLIQFL